ncbi:sensor histidine kinase [Anaerocolumna jejuensis]|uniref:sensor histidine kinase n=1 Tax=Anaerocolumna jejuensis TaxID=259063 RepID=UPI003F7B89DF
MKKKLFNSMRLYFSIMVVFVVVATIIFAGIINLLFTWMNITWLAHLSPIVQITLYCTFVGIFIAFIFDKSIIEPIKKLSNASREVAKGDFSVNPSSKSNLNEMNELFENFRIMVTELGAIETLRSDFVSNVSHEIKTPLNAIEGYATLLQDKNQSEEEKEECILKIVNNTKRLSSLVGNILMLSKVENQSIPLKKTKFALDEQIRQAIVSFESKWMEKELELDVELDSVSYTGMEALMYHVWSNLLDNAIKFTPKYGNISIMLKSGGQQIVCTITDTGVGIPEEAKEHIFDKFYQGDVSHQSEGNGLGLALVKQILDISKGTIEVSSTVGEGAKFIIKLPKF